LPLLVAGGGEQLRHFNSSRQRLTSGPSTEAEV